MGIPVGYVSYYPLKTDALDETGNNNGEAFGGVTFDGEKATFDGVDGYIATNYTLPEISQYTLSVWVSTDDNVNILSNANSSGAPESFRGCIALSGNDNFAIAMGDGVNFWSDESLLDISEYIDEEMHHFLLMVDGYTIKIYIDNILKYTYTSTVSAGTATVDPFFMGRYGAYDGYYASMDASDLYIYERLLTTGEIQSLYNKGAFEVIDLDIVSEDKTFDEVIDLDIVSEDIIPTFIDLDIVSEDKIPTYIDFDITSTDQQGEIIDLDIVSEDIRNPSFIHFHIVSEDIPESYESAIIKRVNE